MGIISPISLDSNGKAQSAALQKTLDKDDFLRLLVSKLTHQDPLKPMDDESFVAELAQFSSLEQLQNLNESFGNSLQWDYLQMQTINNTMATSIIGKEVQASCQGVYLTESNRPMISFNMEKFGASVGVQIRDVNGNIVRTLTSEDVAPGLNSVTWDGRDEKGDRLPTGAYSITITAVGADGNNFTPSTYVQGRVTGVIYREGSAYLQVNGMEIPLSDVQSIGEKES